MGQYIFPAAELTLLIVLTLLQLGRWGRKTEEGPTEALRIAKEAQRRADELGMDLRRHKHAWQDFLNNRFTEFDRIYARKREVELQLETVINKQDTDCDRITAVEDKVGRLTGV